MHSYKLPLTSSLESTMSTQVHGHGIQAITEYEYKYTDSEYIYLSPNPIEPLYSATPTNHASTGAPIVNANWWVCCHCDNMNNPDLAPDRCSVCEHYKCAGCSTVVV
ncbi:hypothetical protein PoHVEF18_009098 [Penicillium ochrochloron]